jgi:hypothetical protein
MQLALTDALATQIVLVRTIRDMIMWRLAMQKALYYLEDRLSYRAAMARMSFLQRRIGILSLWAGLAGDRVGELREVAFRVLTRARGAWQPHRTDAERMTH